MSLSTQKVVLPEPHATWKGAGKCAENIASPDLDAACTPRWRQLGTITGSSRFHSISGGCILVSLGPLAVQCVRLMAFSPRPGCPMCSIVSVATLNPAQPSPLPTSSFLNPTNSSQPEILWKDDNFTAYLEKANPVSSKGHIIIVFK